MPSSDNEHLVRLEIRTAYQDKLLAELNDVVVDLNRNVTDLTRRLVAVERLLGAEFGRRPLADEKPPHY